MYFNNNKTRKNIKFGIKSSIKAIENSKEKNINILENIENKYESLVFYFFNPSLECFYDLIITKAVTSKIYFINSSFK